jgi:hypothetical protein
MPEFHNHSYCISMKLLPTIILSGCLFCGLTATVKADPREAEDIAYRMATSYVAKGFSMAPTDNSGVLGAGQAVRFLIPVTKGLDYVFLAGGDQNARDIDVYVYDEVGNLILDDRRPNKYAGVQFRAAYNGTTIVYLHMAKADGLGCYYVLVGRRGVPKGEGGENPQPEPAPVPSGTPAGTGAEGTDNK